MSSKTVFVDRDNTLIEDPGYISDPAAVRLLPGVELAIKSLAQAGFKVVVVTNQSGIARGLITEEAIQKIHAELRRQLAANGAHLDGIYYCPYHPEGTVEQYAVDSDLQKPKPGMLLKAAGDLDIDLPASWMVGDSARDIEAGQRAGCRTIRVRMPEGQHLPGEEGGEGVQADFTVRNLVDAARLILREHSRRPVVAGDGASSRETVPAVSVRQPDESLNDSEVHREMLRLLNQLARANQIEEFSFTKLIAGIVQILAMLALMIVFWRMLSEAPPEGAMVWGLIAVVLQVMALTFFIMHKPR